MFIANISSSISANPSFCKCRDNGNDHPDNDATDFCCYDSFDYGCHVVWSIEHHRVCHIPAIILSEIHWHITQCDCADESLYNNRAIWDQCCNRYYGDIDKGYDCVITWKYKVFVGPMEGRNAWLVNEISHQRSYLRRLGRPNKNILHVYIA